MIKWIALGVVAALVLLFIFFPVIGWILVGLTALIIALVLFVPVGADVAYVQKQFSLSARWGGLALKLYPRKAPDSDEPPREEKTKKEKKPKEPGEEETEKKKSRSKFKISFNKEEWLELIQRVCKGLKKFGKLKVRKFILHYIAAGENPYTTARIFNFVNRHLSALAPVCRRSFEIGDVDVWTRVDFEEKNMTLDAELSITLRLIQLLRVGVVMAFGVLAVFLKNKRRLKKEAKLMAKAAPPEVPAESGGEVKDFG